VPFPGYTPGKIATRQYAKLYDPDLDGILGEVSLEEITVVTNLNMQGNELNNVNKITGPNSYIDFGTTTSIHADTKIDIDTPVDLGEDLTLLSDTTTSPYIRMRNVQGEILNIWADNIDVHIKNLQALGKMILNDRIVAGPDNVELVAKADKDIVLKDETRELFRINHTKLDVRVPSTFRGDMELVSDQADSSRVKFVNVEGYVGSIFASGDEIHIENAINAGKIRITDRVLVYNALEVNGNMDVDGNATIAEWLKVRGTDGVGINFADYAGTWINVNSQQFGIEPYQANWTFILGGATDWAKTEIRSPLDVSGNVNVFGGTMELKSTASKNLLRVWHKRPQYDPNYVEIGVMDWEEEPYIKFKYQDKRGAIKFLGYQNFVSGGGDGDNFADWEHKGRFRAWETCTQGDIEGGRFLFYLEGGRYVHEFRFSGHGTGWLSYDAGFFEGFSVDGNFAPSTSGAGNSNLGLFFYVDGQNETWGELPSPTPGTSYPYYAPWNRLYLKEKIAFVNDAYQKIDLIADVANNKLTMTGNLDMQGDIHFNTPTLDVSPSLIFTNSEGEMGRLFASFDELHLKLANVLYLVKADGTKFLGFLPTRMFPFQDASYDLGSSSRKWKDGYFGGSVYVDGAVQTSVVRSHDVELTIETSPPNNYFYLASQAILHFIEGLRIETPVTEFIGDLQSRAIYPDTDATYDIGTPTLRYNYLYLAGGVIV